MRKSFFYCFFLLVPSLILAQDWLQKVSYEMEIDFETETHQFVGTQKLIYQNNSPDTLFRVFYHLYFNAFQPNSMMDVRSRVQSGANTKVGGRIQNLTKDEIGYHNIASLKQDGKKVEYQVEGTILVVYLRRPILPGASVTFEMEFNSQVPVQIRRSGRNNLEGIDYSMSQWYPKLCEYDREGWHSNPYIGQEFHGVWGDFDVKIRLDHRYTVAGTGILQNPESIGKGYGPEPEMEVEVPASGKLEWHFKAENVHDFVWAADPDYLHTRFQVPDGPEIHFFFQPDVKENWEQLMPFAGSCFEIMNQVFGEYPYAKYSIIQGGDGGMEYPMATLITGVRSFGSLLGVVVHEVIHSWYQHALATNESLYAWMDEGFTTFAEEFVMTRFMKTPLKNPMYAEYLSYLDLVENEMEEPSSTHADHFQSYRAYSTSAYSKGGICVNQLGYVIGQSVMLRGMKRYYNEWKFRHPTPSDFKRVMEKESGLELDWYFEHWINTTNTIDYKLELEKGDDSTLVRLERVGNMPMPVDVVVTYTDSTQEYYYLPLRIMRGEKNETYTAAERIVLEDWPWTHPTYDFTLPKGIKEIQSVVIDPSYRMADVNRKDNYYPKPKKEKKAEVETYGAVPR